MQTFAYFDSGHEFPEEIVMAAGFTPYKILGDVEADRAGKSTRIILEQGTAGT